MYVFSCHVYSHNILDVLYVDQDGSKAFEILWKIDGILVYQGSIDPLYVLATCDGVLLSVNLMSLVYFYRYLIVFMSF